YWDTNGSTADAGNPADGTWDASATNWTTDSAGTSATTTYTSGSDVVFSAGSDAASATALVDGSISVNSLTFEEGVVNIDPFDSVGDSLASGTVNINVASGATANFDVPTFFNGTFDVEETLYGKEFIPLPKAPASSPPCPNLPLS
ncbi:MAG: hypothetical protein ACK5LK_03080, partial [Chthoniobacterales bacterium]